MALVTVGALDPSLANFGIAKLQLDTAALTLKVIGLRLIETVKDTSKVVRRSSDDLRRGQNISGIVSEELEDCIVVFAEIPSGAQSARAAFALGMATGILSCIETPLIEVQPSETKMAAVGTKTASKEEMVEWAVARFPDAPWIKTKKGGILKKNEHLADAVAVGYAGLKTNDFKRLIAMMKAATLKAA